MKEGVILLQIDVRMVTTYTFSCNLSTTLRELWQWFKELSFDRTLHTIVAPFREKAFKMIMPDKAIYSGNTSFRRWWRCLCNLINILLWSKEALRLCYCQLKIFILKLFMIRKSCIGCFISRVNLMNIKIVCIIDNP